MKILKDTTYHSLFHALPIPCLVLRVCKEGFKVVEANVPFMERSGAKPGDLLHKRIEEAFPRNPDQEEDGVSRLMESLQQVVRTGEKDRIEVLRYDIPIWGTNEFSERYWSPENVPILGKDGEVGHILHIVQEVTDQVMAEKKERQMQQQQRHFVDNNPDGLYSLDVKGNFTSANEGLSRIAEKSITELLKMNFLPFCHPADEAEILEYFHQVISGEAIKFEARFISAKGREMILEISLLPMKIKNKIEGAYGIAKDLTSIKKTEQIIVEKREFLKTHAAFISQLLEHELDHDSLKEAFATIGKTVGADRMYFFGPQPHPDSQEAFLILQVEWTSKNARPLLHHPELQQLAVKEMQQLFGLSSRNMSFTAVIGEMAEGDLRDHCLEQGIKSMLIFPVFLEEQLCGLIGFDDCSVEREWREEEICFLQSVTHQLTTALEKRNAQRELREREEVLAQSEKKFRALVQEGSDLVAIVDEQGVYQFVSETSTRVLGISPEDFIGKCAFDFMHPEDLPTFLKNFAALENRGRVTLGPFRFKDTEGNWRWIETTATNLIHDPAVGGIVTNSRDITTVLTQAREIEHINERYRLAATATQDLMYDWDLVTNQVERFHKTASFLGYKVAETQSTTFWREHVHPDQLAGLQQHLEETLNDRDRTFIHTKYRFRRKDGSYADFLDRAYILRDASGKALRLIGATSDVSEISAKKRELKISNKRFKMAMKATREMIWDWDIPTDQVKRSKSLKRLYGYEDFSIHLEKDYWLSKVHEEDQQAVRASLRAALEDVDKKKWRAEYRFRRASGDYARVIDRGQILRNKKGKAIRMVGAVLDVTASRQAMERIEAQNRRLKDIAWEQSHVVRAPLVRILGLLHLIKAETFEDMSYEEVWVEIETSANELDGIIRKIVSKAEEIGEERVPITDQ